MKLFRKVIFVALLMAFSASAFSQKQEKFGHIDSGKLLSLMPERAQAEKDIADYYKILEDELKLMMEEYEKLRVEINEKQDSLDDFLLNKKIGELQDMEQKINQYRMDAQTRVQQKQEEILKPIIDKAKNAIQTTAKENGYTYIFDTSVGVLLYWPETSDDILPLVTKKLGLQ